MANKFNPDNVLLMDAMTGAVPMGTATEMVKGIIQNSAIMQLGKFEEMTGPDGQPILEKTFTFMAEGPGAYWVGEGEKIQTSKPKWLSARLKTKKLGVIIPVSREFLHYTLNDFFEQVKPLIVASFYKKFDEAGILNVANPFDQSIEQSISKTTQKIEGPMSFDNLLKLEDLLADKGIVFNGAVSTVKNRSGLRGATASVNGVITELYDRHNNVFDGVPVVDIDSAAIKKGTLYLGDFNHLHYGIPYAMHYMVSEDATLSTIKNQDGSDVNLFEQELIALRATMDVAFMITKDEAFAKISAAPGV